MTLQSLVPAMAVVLAFDLPPRADPAGPGRRWRDHHPRRGPHAVGIARAGRGAPVTDEIGPGRSPGDPPAAVRPAADDEPPLAILIDYDGTISLTDVTDMVMVEHVPGVWEEASALYDAGGMGSRRLMAWEMSLVEADPAALARDGRSPAARPRVRAVRPAGAGGRHPDRDRVGRLRLLHRAGARRARRAASCPS